MDRTGCKKAPCIQIVIFPQWLFMRPLFTVAFHEQAAGLILQMYLAFRGAAVLRSTSATRSKYPAFCFSLMTFFATEGSIMSLNAQMLHVHEIFFLLLTNHHHYEIMKDVEKREWSGYFDSLVGCFLLFVFVLILNQREHECKQREGGLVIWISSNIFCAFVFYPIFLCFCLCIISLSIRGSFAISS